MDGKITLTLNSPITDEQWDKITDADFEHTDRIWFETKHRKVEFVKVSAQPEQETGEWIKEDRGGVEYTAVCSKCGYATFWSDTEDFRYCPYCGKKMEESND